MNGFGMAFLIIAGLFCYAAMFSDGPPDKGETLRTFAELAYVILVTAGFLLVVIIVQSFGMVALFSVWKELTR